MNDNEKKRRFRSAFFLFLFMFSVIPIAVLSVRGVVVGAFHMPPQTVQQRIRNAVQERADVLSLQSFDIQFFVNRPNEK